MVDEELKVAKDPRYTNAPDSVWSSFRIRGGAGLLLLASVQFFVAMAVEEALRPGYSLTQNYISDFGVNGGSAHPSWGYAFIFNDSVILLGILAVLGIVAVYPVFPTRRLSLVSAFLLALGSAGAVGVGLFPETSPYIGGHAHDVVSVWTFGFANVGLLLMGLAFARHEKWGPHAPLTTLLGLVATASLVFYLYFEVTPGSGFFGIGPGGLERVVAFPVLLWAILVGVVILRHRVAEAEAPAPVPSPPAPSAST